MVDQKWAVLRAGETAPVSVHDRRQDAVSEARSLALRELSEIVVFDLGGNALPPDQDGTEP